MASTSDDSEGKPKHTIFFSWQSDLRAAGNRTLIENALAAAASEIASEATVFQVDRDTLGLSGSPNIRDSIFAKIESAAAFVADVTPINAGVGVRAHAARTVGWRRWLRWWSPGSSQSDARLSPNPNVMIELGYAIKALDWPRIIMVLNTAHGTPEDLPFDLRPHRCMTYYSPLDATERATQRRALQGQLVSALSSIAGLQAQPNTFALSLSRRGDDSLPGPHKFILDAKLTNRGTRIFRKWTMIVERPSCLMRPGMTHHHQERTEIAERARFRFDETDSTLRRKGLEPGSAESRAIPYQLDDDARRDPDVRAAPITMAVYVDDELVAKLTKSIGELHDA